MKYKRVFLIVLDSVGAGEAPDAVNFGDAGAHTLRSAHETGRLDISNLVRMGIGNIDGLSFLGECENQSAACAKMTERSRGKDTTIGHWEIAGRVINHPLPTFPDGFDGFVLDSIRRVSGREILCNKPYSGTKVLEDFGREHLESGSLIVYTSADSVLQIAAHTSVVPLDELYRICRELRPIMQGEKYGVGRIIARPFTDGERGFVRLPDRKDFSIEPPKNLLPEAVLGAGMDSISVGKIADIFAHQGFNKKFVTHSNGEGMSVLDSLAADDFEGLCFANLVDFDMLWGHRRDAAAYADGISAFDAWLGGFVKKLCDDDALIITADHGCDPSFTKTTDHTREYTPCIIYGKGIEPKKLGTRESFADIAATVADMLGLEFECDGKSMID